MPLLFGVRIKKEKSNKLNPCKKKAIRSICRRLDRNFSPTSVLTTSNLASLSMGRDIESLKFLHSNVHSVIRVSDSSYLKYAMPTITRNNHALNLTPFQAHINVFKFSFFIQRTKKTVNFSAGWNSELIDKSISAFSWKSCFKNTSLLCFVCMFAPYCTAPSLAVYMLFYVHLHLQDGDFVLNGIFMCVRVYIEFLVPWGDAPLETVRCFNHSCYSPERAAVCENKMKINKINKIMRRVRKFLQFSTRQKTLPLWWINK